MLENRRTDQDGHFGPHMKALTAMQQRFVLALLIQGTSDYSAAAKEAGYSTNTPGSLYAASSRLAHDAKVQAALHEESQRTLNGLAPLALAKLKLRVGDDSAPKEQLKAVEMTLNRAGLHARTEHKVVVEHATDEEKIARIMALAKAMNLDPAQLLGEAGVVIEGEYTEVPHAHGRSDERASGRAPGSLQHGD